jgi:hypothetical protein
MTKNSLVVNVYEVLHRAVEEGVSYGIHRAYKYTDDPTHEGLKDALVDAVMLSLSETFLFPETYGE